MLDADPGRNDSDDEPFFWRWEALRVVRRQSSKSVARRLRLPAEQWPWPDAIESPKAVNFKDRFWLFSRLAAAEQTVDYPALGRAGRAAHARLLEAAAWCKDHPSLRERLLHPPAHWSAVDALDAQGTELFHPSRPSYTAETEVFQNGTLGARITRALERPRAAAEMLASPGYEAQPSLLPKLRLAGWVLFGDGADSVITTERTEIVKAAVRQLDERTQQRYEQAIAELDDGLRADAFEWDEGLLRRQLNQPLADELNQSPSL